ncbi:MAG: 50S ribosomal protein L3 [Omnitrophica WOR_2 bacterium RIFCSPLOWO2_12_FULL_50_9]|nr:MAG: 50S ribosomal protein L3 [Omnitrophica WOR_2 bacterium RIFCSPHIGHO2_02_FULL_50_17]OGX42323.1 MAG: 50S ribosomal protein L3 [Omnitrophica WOR_2 bacterium RIFCSPLOWO2_12_FULL_50_9]
MIRGLIGKKLGMTQIFDKEGDVVPVTVVEAGPCTILDIKDSPMKVKLGFDPVRESLVNKPRQGFFKKVGVSPLRMIREFESSDNKDYKVGQQLTADVFKAGDFVDVSGTSIGKGFQGGMKRWHWRGGGATHGSMHHRRVGSIGASADPSRTLPGSHMPGHMGAQPATVQSLRVMNVDVEHNTILVKGAVPGTSNAYLVINRSKKKKFKPLDVEKKAVIRKINPMKQSKAKVAGKAK